MVNWIDLTVLGIAVFSLQLGFQKGFVKQIATFLSIAFGIVLAGKLYLKVAHTTYLTMLARKYGDNVSIVTAYLGIFVITVFFIQLIGFGIRQGIKGKTIEQLDNFCGAFIAVFKVYLIFAVVTWSSFQFLPGHFLSKQLAESYAAPKVSESFEKILAQIPETYSEGLYNFFSKQGPVRTNIRNNYCYSKQIEDIPVWRPE